MRGATSAISRASCVARFQSTRPMRGATIASSGDTVTAHVSIHAPHAGRDHNQRANHKTNSVSIHAPHAGRDQCLCVAQNPLGVSIHAPHAGRDHGGTLSASRRNGFNPRAPCGARHPQGAQPPAPEMFQSTRPMRGATAADEIKQKLSAVSIHAPHAGRDARLALIERLGQCFNPRAPCGARPLGNPAGFFR